MFSHLLRPSLGFHCDSGLSPKVQRRILGAARVRLSHLAHRRVPERFPGAEQSAQPPLRQPADRQPRLYFDFEDEQLHEVRRRWTRGWDRCSHVRHRRNDLHHNYFQADEAGREQGAPRIIRYARVHQLHRVAAVLEPRTARV